MATIGAIRWDAWYTNNANTPGRYTAASLSPERWHDRVPVHGVIERKKVTWDYDQASMDAEIAAAATCLDYWAFIKYPIGGSGLLNGWDLYQSSADKADIDWCWIQDTGRMGSTGNYSAFVTEVTAHMQQANYHKVMTNRPLLYILYYDTDLDVYWGGSLANLKAALDALRTSVQGAGLGNPYIVLMRGGASTAGPIKTSLGCDALSSYVPPIPSTPDATYATFMASTAAYWAALITYGTKIVPIGSIGWAQQPRMEIPNPYVANKPYFGLRKNVALPTNSEITAHIDAIYDFMTANYAACEAETAIVYAWNEFDEGGWIAPTHGDPTGLRCAAVAAGKPVIPEWVTPGAKADGDFVNDRYWMNGSLVTQSAFLSCVRAGTAADFGDSTGAIGSYAANVVRRNDRGLLIEPATENRWIYSNLPSDASWTKNEITPGTVSAGFTPMSETTVSALHRLFRSSGISLTLATPYTFTWTMKKRGRRYVFIRISLDGGATSKNVGFDLDNVVTTYVGSGLSATLEKVGNTYFLSVTASLSNAFPVVSLATSNVAVTSDSVPASYAGDTAQGFHHRNLDVVLGSVKRSPVDTAGSVATRAADAYTTTLVGNGTHNITFIFDDDSQQVIPGISAGAYAYPTNLNRPLVKRIVWGSV